MEDFILQGYLPLLFAAISFVVELCLIAVWFQDKTCRTERARACIVGSHVLGGLFCVGCIDCIDVELPPQILYWLLFWVFVLVVELVFLKSTADAPRVRT